MANPQAESGHIRIANELWNEILRRDFSKRQQNLILFIWRLSYGTGQKDCKVDKFNLFELSGIHKQDIKNELNFLRDCSVLNWDEDTMVFSINKDYNLWQITPNKKWDKDKFNDLIHQNLQRKKVSKTLTEQKQKVSKTLTFKNKLVSKIRTMQFVKYEPTHDGNIVIPTGSTSLYPLLKTLKIIDIKKIKKRKDEDEHKSIVDYLIKNNIVHPAHITSTLSEDISDVFDSFGFDDPKQMIVEAIKDAVRGNGRTWKFVYNKLHYWRKQGFKNVQDIQSFEDRSQNKQVGQRKDNRVAPLPKWMNGEPIVLDKSPEEIKQREKELESFLNSL